MKFVKRFVFSLAALLVAALFVLGNPKFALADDDSDADEAAYSEQLGEGWNNPWWEKKEKKKASGVELQLGFGYVAAGRGTGFNSGFTANLDIGYRWDWIGFTIDFEASLFPEGGPYFCRFHASALFSYNIDKFEIWGKLGLGVDYLWILAVPSLKLAVGASYRMTEILGVGVDFAYIPSLRAMIGFGENIHVISPSVHLRFFF